MNASFGLRIDHTADFHHEHKISWSVFQECIPYCSFHFCADEALMFGSCSKKIFCRSRFLLRLRSKETVSCSTASKELESSSTVT